MDGIVLWALNSFVQGEKPMFRTVTRVALVLALALTSLQSAHCSRVSGEVVRVENRSVLATFPVPVKHGSMMTIMTGEGDGVAGLAISRGCKGYAPPYEVEGDLYLTMDAVNLAAGKKICVNSVNTMPAPSAIPSQAARGPHCLVRDLGLYYYAAGETVGYGALGVGYERSIRLSKGFAVQLDAGITGVGGVDSANAEIVNTQQLIKNAVGRLKFNFSPGFGFYSAYRWNQGRGDVEHWSDVVKGLGGKSFLSPSELEAGTVESRGIEYGVLLQPCKWLGMSAGFIPSYRADYGSYGVRSQPAYTAEFRLGAKRGGARFRGLYSDGYWIGDLGITLR
jgi:hypothetical protein